jgi:hypothetical protein
MVLLKLVLNLGGKTKYLIIPSFRGEDICILAQKIVHIALRQGPYTFYTLSESTKLDLTCKDNCLQ